MPRSAVLVLVALALAAPGAQAATSRATPTIRIVLAGDVMLGRGVARLAASDPTAVLAGVRYQLESADLTVANLESPLTNRPHRAARGANALEARPATARLLAEAGFDALAIANNHAGDAGPATVPDTMSALATARLAVIGGGANEQAAFTPTILRTHGVTVAFLSFDATTEGPRASPTRPGVAWWDAAHARSAVARARAAADVVVVGLHGGSDYNPTTDPYLAGLAHRLAAWGADIVWGTGPHVVQPTRVIEQRDGRTTVVATSLGNLVFDQHAPGTRQGELLEVLAGPDGVRAYRLGATAQEPSNAVTFARWQLPRGDAAALAGEWWTLARPVAPAAIARPTGLKGFPGKVVAAAVGDTIGNGTRQLVVSFWRPYRPTDVNNLIRRDRLVDHRGLTSHVGLYRPADRSQIWVAGTVLRPVARLAPCDGALAVAYTALNGTALVGAGAWQWKGFGFAPLPDLPGPGLPRCADVDGDNRLDPVILGRA